MSGKNTKDHFPHFLKKTSLRGTHEHLLIVVQGDKRGSYCRDSVHIRCSGVLSELTYNRYALAQGTLQLISGISSDCQL